MRSDWFRPRKLARRLAAGEVSNREVAYLMLGNMAFASVIFYGAFTWANAPWTVLSLLEFISVVTVTFVGFTRAYDAAGGDKNSSFALLFNCLSFGIWFWATLVVWVVYWAAIWVFKYGVFAAYRFENLALARNLAEIGASYEWLWTFIAAVAWQAIFYVWLARVIPRARGDA